MTDFERKKQLSNEIRQLICSKYDAGKTTLMISNELELNYETVKSVLRLYKASGRIEAKKQRRPKPKKINLNEEVFITNLISEDVSITLENIKSKLREETGIIVSKSSIARSIENMNYSFKRVQLIPERRNLESNIEARFTYANQYLNLDEDKIIFLDEFGVNCSMRIPYGRSLRGESPRKIVRAIRSRNYSISAAITKNGLLKYRVLNRGYTGDEYTLFIESVLIEMNLTNMSGYTFVLDNCSIHKVQSVRTLVEASTNNLLFLPPYSPQLNAIEEFFSKWKHNIRSMNCNNVEELNDAITVAQLNIDLDDCLGFFRNVRRHALKAVRREDF